MGLLSLILSINNSLIISLTGIQLAWIQAANILKVSKRYSMTEVNSLFPYFTFGSTFAVLLLFYSINFIGIDLYLVLLTLVPITGNYIFWVMESENIILGRLVYIIFGIKENSETLLVKLSVEGASSTEKNVKYHLMNLIRKAISSFACFISHEFYSLAGCYDFHFIYSILFSSIAFLLSLLKYIYHEKAEIYTLSFKGIYSCMDSFTFHQKCIVFISLFSNCYYILNTQLHTQFLSHFKPKQKGGILSNKVESPNFIVKILQYPVKFIAITLIEIINIILYLFNIQPYNILTGKESLGDVIGIAYIQGISKFICPAIVAIIQTKLITVEMFKKAFIVSTALLSINLLVYSFSKNETAANISYFINIILFFFNQSIAVNILTSIKSDEKKLLANLITLSSETLLSFTYGILTNFLKLGVISKIRIYLLIFCSISFITFILCLIFK